MRLIIVDKSQPATYARLREQFVDDPEVKVVFEQRKTAREGDGEERRRLHKPLDGRGFIVVHTADDTNRSRK
jgi:hypothetical protein